MRAHPILISQEWSAPRILEYQLVVHSYRSCGGKLGVTSVAFLYDGVGELAKCLSFRIESGIAGFGKCN